ncbi:cysteine desulfurase family protein [Peptoniphilus obesi]|uniref:cysteine desulfurase family protein n=1 Tax=Peptoniphilus obesi TaxID=1472765 RepID=UPI0004BB8609|nr:cysteine desulfurase family protein [Peptoniphilus obesi]
MDIYLDNAATTKLNKEVLSAMEPYLKDIYSNPSSVYSFSKEAKNAVEEARDNIAKILKVDANEIFFTSGGSESDNWAIKGVAFNNYANKGKIITSPIEHKAVLESVEYLKKFSYDVDYLKVDNEGKVDLDSLRKLLDSETILLSIMFANNEIGTIQPIKEISKILEGHKALFHVDAVQALGSLEFDINDLGADLMSFSSHKIGGPKGIGILYIKNGTPIDSFIHGGSQEKNKRAGTENVASIVGLSKAFDLLAKSKKENIKKIKEMKDFMLDRLLKVDGVYLNGSREDRLPGNINISIDGVESQLLLILLDKSDIFASSGSACNAGSINPSHVLKAIGRNDNLAKNCLRLTINENNNIDEIKQASDIIINTINKLRS